MSAEEILHNYERFGSHHIACGRVLHSHRSAAAPWLETKMRGVAAPMEPVRHIVEGARAYASLRGLPDPHQGVDYHSINQTADRIHHLARAYDRLPNFDPHAVPHFAAMRDEIHHQYDHLTNRMGVRVEPVEHDPYRNSHEMAEDLRNNRRIQVMKTSVTGAHPFFSDEDNDKFRAVHDAFGHAGTGRDFDGHGEEAAFHAHARMFANPMARGALASETRGQNGSVIVHDQFSPQKIAVMHHDLWTPEGMHHTSAHSEGLMIDAYEEPGQRIATLLDDNNKPTEFFAKIAHVSGNQIDVLHCPFCGSGAVVARSDGSIQCTFCNAAFTVTVSPLYASFPMSVGGQPYPWPGRPDGGVDPNAMQMGDEPGGGFGGQLIPGGADGAAAGDPDDDGGNPFADDDGDDGGDADPKASDGDDDDKEAEVGGSKKPPFGKKKSSYKTVHGGLVPRQEYLRHLAIVSSPDPKATAQRIKAERSA